MEPVTLKKAESMVDIVEDAKTLLTVHRDYYDKLTKKLEFTCDEIKNLIKCNKWEDAERLFVDSLQALWFSVSQPEEKEKKRDNSWKRWEKVIKDIKPVDAISKQTTDGKFEKPRISGFLTELFVLIFCRKLFVGELAFKNSVNIKGNTERVGGKKYADVYIEDGKNCRLAIQVKTCNVNFDYIETMNKEVDKEVKDADKDKFCFILIIASTEKDYPQYKKLKELADFFIFFANCENGEGFKKLVKELNHFGWFETDMAGRIVRL